MFDVSDFTMVDRSQTEFVTTEQLKHVTETMNNTMAELRNKFMDYDAKVATVAQAVAHFNIVMGARMIDIKETQMKSNDIIIVIKTHNEELLTRTSVLDGEMNVLDEKFELSHGSANKDLSDDFGEV